jgi:hypothetical protein
MSRTVHDGANVLSLMLAMAGLTIRSMGSTCAIADNFVFENFRSFSKFCLFEKCPFHLHFFMSSVFGSLFHFGFCVIQSPV